MNCAQGLLMKTYLVWGIALFGFLGVAPAFSADLSAPIYRQPIVQAVPYTWQGFYVGGNVGYGFGKDDLHVSGFNVNTVAIPGTTAASLKQDGILGGVQAGYNLQITPSWVVGIETDIQWMGQKSNLSGAGPITSTSCFGDPNPPCTLTGAGSGNLAAAIDWFGTLRGRLGMNVDRTLFYGTGGLAYGRIKTSGAASFAGTFTDSSGGTCDNGGAGCAATGTSSFGETKTKIGWTAGAGVESGLGLPRNWSWRVEYLYVDLGSANSSVPYSSTVSIPGKPLTQTVSGTSSYGGSVTDQIVRFGTNYKFGG